MDISDVSGHVGFCKPILAVGAFPQFAWLGWSPFIFAFSFMICEGSLGGKFPVAVAADLFLSPVSSVHSRNVDFQTCHILADLATCLADGVVGRFSSGVSF